MENGHEKLVQYLKDRKDPVLKWGDPHVELVDQTLGRIYTGWIDVHVPDIQEACETNWVWTIESVADREEDWTTEFYTIDLPYDLDVHIVRDPYAIHHPSQKSGEWYEADDILHVAVPRGGQLSGEQAAELAEQLSAGEDRTLRTVGGWREETINTAIKDWCEEHAGREYTVEYEPDQPLSGMEAVLAERLTTAQESGESYLIGVTADGTEIHASAEAFDAFAGLAPEEVAEAIRAVEESVGAHLTRREEPEE